MPSDFSKTRSMHYWMRFLLVQSVLLLAVIANWQSSDGLQQHLTSKPESAVMAPRQHTHHDAVITDATQLYRICTSRPQRIVPTQSSQPERLSSSLSACALRHSVKPFKSIYDSRTRLETSPFCVSASRDYYVIALRHIIR